MNAKLARATFLTSRLLDFTSQKELTAQVGHGPRAWPLVVAKELIDNGLDACEDAGIAPGIAVTVDERAITVSDNGPGIPADTIEALLDFSVRVSSREAYVSPTRGAQGNALKTIVAMPFVLDGERGRVDISARGRRHEITLEVDRIRQEPKIERRECRAGDVKKGTTVRVHWPDSAGSILEEGKKHFLQLADAFSWLNPHLTLTVDWRGDRQTARATDRSSRKWRPSDPTSPAWYKEDHLERLAAAYIAHDADHGRDRTVREFISEFRGLSATAKQKAVLDETGLSRMNLSALSNGNGLERSTVSRLLHAMKEHSKPVRPKALGSIGKEHVEARCRALGAKMESFRYRRRSGETRGIPWVIETAFAWCPERAERLLVTGVNWSPGITNPFRELGPFGKSLDSILEEERAGRDEPIALLLHMVSPRVEYTDRGKSAVVIEGGGDEDEET